MIKTHIELNDDGEHLASVIQTDDRVGPLTSDDRAHLMRIDARLAEDFDIGSMSISLAKKKAEKDRAASPKDIAGRARMFAISRKLKISLSEAADHLIRIAGETESPDSSNC